MDEGWFTRPILPVVDVGQSLAFYVDRLGFAKSWSHEEDGVILVSQVEREGCALILSSQWPGKIGAALIFVSLNADGADLNVTAALEALRVAFEGRGVVVEQGWWGYRVLIVRDPDGNELLFNYPNGAD